VEVILKVCVGATKNQFAANNERRIDTRPGTSPPYHALMVTAGKKKMKGNAVGPTPGVRACLARQANPTLPTATL